MTARVLITGSAGFIGFHAAQRLLTEGHEVIGYDGLTPYYDVTLKHARTALLARLSGFRFEEGMLEDSDRLAATIARHQPHIVLHFAAQAGVRYSLENPAAYVSANVEGTFNLLEALRASPPRHLLVASTSSVYGANPDAAFAETARTDFPVSTYAATKRAAEALTHAYAHLNAIPTTVLRLFTVYGPWGRPDMAAFRFTRAIEHGEPIELYGEGRPSRDFTYVDDVVEAVMRLSELPPTGSVGAADSLSPVAPWRVVNVGGGHPVGLVDFVEALETALGKRAARRLVAQQAGDVDATRADTTLLRALIGYAPETSLAQGLAAFADWYRAEGHRFGA